MASSSVAPKTGATALPSPQVDPDFAADPASVLFELQQLIGTLSSSANPIHQSVATRLNEDTGLLGYVMGVRSTQGRSFDDEVRTASRDRYIRKLYATSTWSIAELCTALMRYRTDVWPRVMSGPNPHGKDSTAFLLFQIMLCKPQALSQSRIRAILNGRD
jgi:hypothetical protein